MIRAGWWIFAAVVLLAALKKIDEPPAGYVAAGEGVQIAEDEYYDYLDSRLREKPVGTVGMTRSRSFTEATRV